MAGESVMSKTALLAVFCWCWAAAGGARPAAVDVPRCCPLGAALPPAALRTDLLQAAAVPAACQPEPVETAAAGWAPRVYAPARGTFLDSGRLPAHWRTVYSRLPACDELRVLREHAASYALLANNASLWMRGVAQALPTDRYCADAAVALVCSEDAGGRGLAKCCAEGRIFNGSRCEEDEVGAGEALRELRALAGERAVYAGWPACAEGSRYAVAGALGGARLLEDGALELRGEGSRLDAGAWCAEAVAGESGTRVLACEAAARATRPPRTARHALYGAGLAVGAAFLAATLAAGFALPAAHHALHWRCQTHYVAALMLGDVLLAATQLAGDRVPPALCSALGEHLRLPPDSFCIRFDVCVTNV